MLQGEDGSLVNQDDEDIALTDEDPSDVQEGEDRTVDQDDEDRGVNLNDEDIAPTDDDPSDVQEGEGRTDDPGDEDQGVNQDEEDRAVDLDEDQGVNQDDGDQSVNRDDEDHVFQRLLLKLSRNTASWSLKMNRRRVLSERRWKKSSKKLRKSSVANQSKLRKP